MTIRRFLSILLLAGTFGSSSLPLLAQTQKSPELFYTFFGQKISLTEQPDAIAVSFKANSRGRNIAMHLQLKQDLINGTQGSGGGRSGGTANSAQIEVKPVGDQYAIVQLGSPQLKAEVTQQIRKQQYIASTLPILSNANKDSIILPNEILVSLSPNLSEQEASALLSQQKLEVVRKLRFTKNRYIVKAKNAEGTAILNAANQLSQVKGVQSATPNFIQSIARELQSTPSEATTLDESSRLTEALEQLPKLQGLPINSDLLPQQWYLNSTPRRGTSLPRTDVRATEAWQKGTQGDGVVVAVIDSTIQWDHPDLKDNLYQVPKNTPDALPNETSGWDFIENDADTRLSFNELSQIQPFLRDSFELSDAELIKTYPKHAASIKQKRPKWTNGQIARNMRNSMQSYVTGQFHGTWSAGVIAARPSQTQGLVGVAPKAKILPVRGIGLDGSIRPETQIEAISYAAARNADVINMSFGGAMPSQDVANTIFSILDANPKIVFVGSAGNSNVDQVSFPAAVPGVISVGATNLDGARSPYSSYGQRLDVVAPGGDISRASSRGILTTGGTGSEDFWQGVTNLPKNNVWAWNTVFDPKGSYVQVQGTSFSAPVVSGIVALMKAADPKRKLTRDRIATILKSTASYNGLTVSRAEQNQYRLKANGPNSGTTPTTPVKMEQYFFGSGLVNAEAAIAAVKNDR